VLYRDRIVKLLSLIISTKKLGHERVNYKSCRNSLKHSDVAGGKWRHAPQGAGLGGFKQF